MSTSTPNVYVTRFEADSRVVCDVPVDLATLSLLVLGLGGQTIQLTIMEGGTRLDTDTRDLIDHIAALGALKSQHQFTEAQIAWLNSPLTSETIGDISPSYIELMNQTGRDVVWKIMQHSSYELVGLGVHERAHAIIAAKAMEYGLTLGMDLDPIKDKLKG